MDRPTKPKILIIANISTVPDNLTRRLHMFGMVTTTKTTDLDILNEEIVTVIDDFKHIIMIDTTVLKLAQIAICLGKWHRENPDGALIIGGGISVFCFNMDRFKRLFRALDLSWCLGGITDSESVLHLTPGMFPPTQWPSALPGPTVYLNNVASADKRYISRTTNDLYAAVAHRGTVMWLGFSCEHQGYTELALSLIARCVEGDCDNSSRNDWHELGSQHTSLELAARLSMEVTGKAGVLESSDLVKIKDGVEPQGSNIIVVDDIQSAYQYQRRPTDAIRLMDRPATCFNFDNDQECDENGENTDNVEEGKNFGFGVVDAEKEGKLDDGLGSAAAVSIGSGW